MESAVPSSPLHPNFPNRLLGYVIVFDTVSRRVNSKRWLRGPHRAARDDHRLHPMPRCGLEDDRGCPARRWSRVIAEWNHGQPAGPDRAMIEP